MGLRNIRYYIWVCSLIFGSAGFYTVVIVGGVNQLISIDGNYLRAVYISTYVVFSFFGLFFYIPRLRNVWLGNMMDERYMSRWGSWVGIVIGAATATMIFMPQVKKIDLLDGVSNSLVAAAAFLVFTLIMFVLSFYVGSSQDKR